MRHLRMALGLAVALCVFAVTAVPAMAHEFVPSKAGALKAKGTNEFVTEEGVKPQEQYNKAPDDSRVQVFKFSSRLTIKCLKTRASGTIPGPSETVELAVKFTTCGWYPQASSPLHTGARFELKEGKSFGFVFHANGFTEFVGNPELEEIEWKEKPISGEVEVLETATELIIPGHVCRIVVPAQTIPVKAVMHPEEEFTSVVYKNIEVPTTNKKFPSGFQKKVVFESNLKGIKYELKGGEGTEQCEQFLGEEKKGSGGNYKGNITVEVVGGDLTHT